MYFDSAVVSTELSSKGPPPADDEAKLDALLSQLSTDHNSPTAQTVSADFSQLELPLGADPLRNVSKAHAKAAKMLQKAWRTAFQFRKTVDLAKKMVNDNTMFSDYVKEISFETLVVHLRDKPVIQASKNLIQRLHLLCAFRHGTPAGFNGNNVNVRVVLAAYMIAYRPTHVFESMGQVETDLVVSAKTMLATLESITQTLMKSVGKRFAEVPAVLTKNFQTIMFDYLKSFKAWKIPDEAKLTCRIKHALVALYQAQQHLPPNEPSDSKLNLEFHSQIERLRLKLLQIAGQEALDKFDADRLAGATSSGGGGGGFGGRGGGGSGGYADLPGRMKNEQLAHELLLDETFQLTESGNCEDNLVFRRIRESFHRAFWESLVDDIRLSPPCYVRVFKVLTEIRDGIVDLSVTSGETAREVLDIEHLEVMVASNAFGWPESKKLVHDTATIIRAVQAPRRDEETKAKLMEVAAVMDAANNKDSMAAAFTKSLEFLLDRVNAMRIDAANARLRLIAPVIKDHGIDYETGKFQDKLNSGAVSLDNTKSWIHATLKSALDIASQVQDGAAGSVLETHSLAVTLLIDGSILPDVTETSVPETLGFDVSRLRTMRQDFDDIVKANIVMVVTSHKDAAELPKVVRCFEGLDDNEPLDLKSVATTAELERSFFSSTEPSSELYQLLRKRLSKHIRSNIAAPEPKKIKLSPLTVPNSIDKRADRLVRTIRAVSKLNRTVHNKLYNEIVPEIARAVCAEGI